VRSLSAAGFKTCGLLLLSCGWVGCSYLPPEWQKKLADWGLTQQAPADANSAAATTGPSGPQEAAETSERRAHVELLAEVYRVTFVKEPTDAEWLSGYADNLRQGGSIEGIYNGWVRSGEYRIHENEKGAAPAGALKAFARELALIESELSKARVFTQDDAKPARLLTQDEEDAVRIADAAAKQTPETPPTPGTFGQPLDGAPLSRPGVTDASSLASRYEMVFISSRLFTMKRILGEEALRLVSEKSNDRRALAEWYSRWANRMADRGVDFGHPKRNLGEVEFHHEWAMQYSVDRLSWEVLNRLHRVLNQAAQP
jgi:hypothetical protein